MPLKEEKSQKVISWNIKELYKGNKKSGKVKGANGETIQTETNLSHSIKQSRQEQSQTKEEVTPQTKTELRIQRMDKIDKQLGSRIEDFTSSLGITKSLTGGQKEKLLPIVVDITKLLAEKFMLKGQELKDAVLDYFKDKKIPIDDDLKGIVQDNVDNLTKEPKKEEAPKEEPIKEPADKSKGTAGISNKVQEAKAAELGAEVPLRQTGISSQDAVTEGRIRYNAMNDAQKEAYFKDLRTRLNNKDPLKTMTKKEDLFISRAHSVEMEGELNSLHHQIEESTGAEKKALEKKLDDALRTWQKFEKETINPLEAIKRLEVLGSKALEEQRKIIEQFLKKYSGLLKEVSKKKESNLPKEEVQQEAGKKLLGTSGISTKAQVETASKFGIDAPERLPGMSNQKTVDEGRRGCNGMTDEQKVNHFKTVMLKVYLILFGALILFHVCFVSSKRYDLGGHHLTEKQYSTALANGNTQLKVLLLNNSNKIHYLFGLPERTIYFIYSGYFLLFASFVLTYGGIINKNQKNDDKESFLTDKERDLLKELLENLKEMGMDSPESVRAKFTELNQK